MDEQHKAFLKRSFETYLELLSNLHPTHRFLDFNFDFLDNRGWYLLGKEMVESDLRELTNLLNRWQDSLDRWQAWNQVISNHDEDAAWELRREFLEALAHECLLRPSALRDTLTSVATNALHQVRLSNDPTYRDHLPGDPETPTDRQKLLTRPHKEKRLQTIVDRWPGGDALMKAIRRINGPEYKQATSDYRNLVNHTLGPRLGIGAVRMVTRHVKPATKPEKGSDGRFHDIPVPGEMCVSYGFGGTPPLDLVAARRANEGQFRHARDCYEKYLDVLKSAVADIKPQV